MKTTRLGDGRYASVAALEILRIPDESVLSDRFDDQALGDGVRDEFTQLITEFASLREVLGSLGQVAAEVVWRSTPVDGQLYEAEIRTFVVLRALTAAAVNGSDAVADLAGLFRSTLAASGYDVAELDEQALSDIYGTVEPASVVAVQRRGRTLFLPHQAVPAVFDYDRLPDRTVTIERLFAGLVETAGAVVSVQIEATRFDASEIDFLTATSTALGALEKGGSNPAVGGLSVSAARRPADTYSHYSDRAAAPMFVLNVVVAGAARQTRMLSSRVMGAFAAAAKDGAIDLAPVILDAETVGFARDVAALPWRVTAAIDAVGGSSMTSDVPPAAKRLPRLVTAREASQVFRLPYGNDRVGAGFRVNHTNRRRRTFMPGVVDNDIDVGFIGRTDTGISIGFTLDDLTKHMFVAGTPGSGKTTFSVGLLDKLWRQHEIPFLVIEPAKNEYRAMLEAIPDLRVFTPGKSWLSPLILNPFRPADGVRIENHKTVLKTAFGAALTMTSPLDRLFDTALDELYASFGWLDSDSTTAGHLIPNVRDFVMAFEKTFARVGYTGDALNIGRAGLVRLAALVRAFDTYKSIPIADLCRVPTVIELSAIESQSEKTLYIGLILLLMLSYHNANTVGQRGLRQVLLLEEAHVLFEATDSGMEGAASPAAIAQGLLKRMLAEIRAYGVGIVIADQSPRKVGSDVIALTNIKLAFRIVEAQDRQIVGSSTNMSEEQVRRLAGLRPGEAFLFHDRLTEPEEVVTPDYREATGIATSISDDELQLRNVFYTSASDLLLPFPECALVPVWDPTRGDVARQFAARVFAQHVRGRDLDAHGVRAVYRGLRLLCAELDPRFPRIDDVLLDMVRVYFLRLIRFETELEITSEYMSRVLSETSSRAKEQV